MKQLPLQRPLHRLLFIFIALAFVNVSFAKDLTEQDLLHPGHVQQSLRILREEGGQAYLKYWRNNLDEAANFQAWCEEQKAENGGQPHIYDLDVHKDAVAVIEWLNKENANMGFDCYQVRANVVSEAFQVPSTPLVGDRHKLARARYSLAKIARSAVVPILGFFIVSHSVQSPFLQEWSWLKSGFKHPSPEFMQHGREMIQANVKTVLELQFAILSGLWSVAWSAEYLPTLRLDSQHYFSKVTNALKWPFAKAFGAFNKAVAWNKGRVLKAGLLWGSAVNILMYPFLMGSAAYLGQALLENSQHPGVVEGAWNTFATGVRFIREQFLVSFFFNAAFIPFQVVSAEARNQSWMRESGRFYYESAGAFLGNLFRGISAIYPSTEMAMAASQFALGLVLSGPMVAKAWGASLYAEETGRLARELRGVETKEESPAVATEVIQLTETQQAALKEAQQIAEEAAASKEAPQDFFSRLNKTLEQRYPNLNQLWKSAQPALAQLVQTAKDKALEGVSAGLSVCETALAGAKKFSLAVFDKWTWGFGNNSMLLPLEKNPVR